MEVKIKVCGMREPVNILALSRLDIDFIGYIFYDQSSRFIDVSEELPEIPQKKVGVFVNPDESYILQNITNYHLDIAQLHGNESPEFCEKVRDMKVDVVKAFSVDEYFDFDDVKAYMDRVDYFLFDTKGKNYGGNGISFDWSLLQSYDGEIPFWLSGGITLSSVEDIRSFFHPMLYAIDINSGFEIKPGFKDVSKIQKFIDEIRN